MLARRPKKAISVGKLSDLSSAGTAFGFKMRQGWDPRLPASAHALPYAATTDLGAAKTVGVVTNPSSAPMEDIPRWGPAVQRGRAFGQCACTSGAACLMVYPLCSPAHPSAAGPTLPRSPSRERELC